MTTPTHSIAGFLISKWFITAGLIPPEMKGVALAVGIIAANGPDFDVIFSHQLFEHRNSAFHIPMYWVVPIVTLILLFFSLGLYILSIFLLIILLCVIAHFLMDSICVDSGIRWLAPYNQHEYGIRFVKTSATDFKTYLNNNLKYPLLIIDLAVWIYFLTWGRFLFRI
jgi:membrane-bound metal-dependent hydrolase YbcI (DUF457 family)